MSDTQLSHLCIAESELHLLLVYLRGALSYVQSRSKSCLRKLFG